MSQGHNNIALAHIEQHDWDAAQEWFGRSLEIKRKSGDVLGQALAFNNLLRVHMAQGEFEEALKMAAQATHYFQFGGDHRKAALRSRTSRRRIASWGRLSRRANRYRRGHQVVADAGDSGAVDEIRAAVASLDARVGLPWLAWIAVVLGALFVALFIAAIIFVLVSEI